MAPGVWRSSERGSLRHPVRPRCTRTSYFLDNPTRGDQFNQTDHRTIVGGATHAQAIEAFDITLRPVAFRRADISTRLASLSRSGAFASTRSAKTKARQKSAAACFEAESRWTVVSQRPLGARADVYSFDDEQPGENSGNRTASIARPEGVAGLPAIERGRCTSAGYGFHSNDARGTTMTVDPSSGDAAQRVNHSFGRAVPAWPSRHPARRRSIHDSAWALNLDGELLFTGDAGTTEPPAESHRRGVTFANFIARHRRCRSTPTYRSPMRNSWRRRGQSRIPGRSSVVAGGVAWSPVSNGVFGAPVRHWRLPADEDNSVRASNPRS